VGVRHIVCVQDKLSVNKHLTTDCLTPTLVHNLKALTTVLQW